MQKITLSLSPEYSCYIENGLRNSCFSMIYDEFKPSVVCVVSDKNVFDIYGSAFITGCEGRFGKVLQYILEPGEQSKDVRSIEGILAYLLKNDADRNVLLIALGGGVVGDITGLAASVYKRGVRFVQVPTTVISQTDSSVGGKNGVDYEGVKNVIGTFYQPSAVYIDPEFLKTLPEEILTDGLGEVVKYSVLKGGPLYERIMHLESASDFLKDCESVIYECVEYKAGIVEEDEHDTGLRHLLNLGHTWGHAIEASGEMTHGRAVFAGLYAIANYGSMLGVSKNSICTDLALLASRLGFKCTINKDPEVLSGFVLNDKKSQGDSVKVILPLIPGKAEIMSVDKAQFCRKMAEISCEAGSSGLKDNEEPQNVRKLKYDRIAIIGMPCSGKSSIGKLIAAHFGMDFYDLDTEIETFAGMSIESIFREKGEAEFRRIETEVTAKTARKMNAVIATGGGIVTKPDSMAFLKVPETLVLYIHRDFYKIATTPKRIMDKRPVLQSTSFDKLFSLYKARLPLYKKYADLEVKNDTNKEESVKVILKTLEDVLYDGIEVLKDEENTNN